MLKVLQLLILVFLVSPGAAFSKPAVLLFSDLVAAPNTGWDSNSPNRGAVVTVWGTAFGNKRGTSFITVNGQRLSSDSDYWGTWGETGKPIPYLQRIVFQLNSTIPEGAGGITLTINGQQSNTLDFNVNNGRIFFTDANHGAVGDGSIGNPWNKPNMFLADVKPGDILYFRGGVYSEKYTGGKSTIWIRNIKTPGTSAAPIVFTGFPGETAVIDSLSSGSSSYKSGIKIESSYYTVANLKFTSYSNGIQGGDYTRIVGNDVQGGATIVDGTGIIVLTRNGGKVLGNSVHGGRSANRLDHGIYISGCAPIEGNEVGWNHVYDNSFDRGPMIVVNHQGTRCPSDVHVKSHYIHNNFVDCSNFASRGIGIYDLSWDGAPENEPEPTYVYGNIVYQCGISGTPSDHPSVYQNAASGRWYNNSIIESRTRAVSIGGDRFLSAEFKNNILTQSNSDDNYLNENPLIKASNNIFFGGKNPPSFATNSLYSDPKVTIDTANWKFTLDLYSPAIDSGTEGLAFNLYDIIGSNRPVNHLIDIGALEYMSPPLPPSGLSITPKHNNIE